MCCAPAVRYPLMSSLKFLFKLVVTYTTLSASFSSSEYDAIVLANQSWNVLLTSPLPLLNGSLVTLRYPPILCASLNSLDGDQYCQ